MVIIEMENGKQIKLELLSRQSSDNGGELPQAGQRRLL